MSIEPASLSFPFRDLLSASSIIFYQCEIEDDFPLRFISSNVRDILGISPERFEQDDQLWTDRIHPDDRNRVVNAFEHIVENDSFTMEYRFKHEEGHYIWLYDEVKLVKDNSGTPDSVVGSSIDISERKHAEQDLRELNELLEHRIQVRTQDLLQANDRLRLLEMAIANINDMVVITKSPKSTPLDSDIVFVNKAFEEFTGYSAEEVTGRTPVFLHGPDTSGQALQRINDQIRNLEPLREEFINYKKDGTPYWVELDMAPFPAGTGDEMYWVGINRDITRRKKAEQRIQESLKEKEVMLSEIHHRVKNNLAVISGLLDLQAFNEENQEVGHKLSESQARIQSIAMVHEKLYQSESLSSIQMDTYIDHLTSYISGVFVDQQHADIEICNNADPIALGVRQAVPCGLILNELITNAFKHAFDSSKGVLGIELYKEDTTVFMQVQDNGTGLPEDFQLCRAYFDGQYPDTNAGCPA